MKRWNEYTDEELLAMYDEGGGSYKTLVDLECAYEGLPLLPPHPGPQPVYDVPEKDVTLYEVGGVLVTTPEAANDILSVLIKYTLWNEEYRPPANFVKKMATTHYGYPEVKVKQSYSEEFRATIVDEMKVNAKALEEWRALKKDYDNAVGGRADIEETIEGRISEHRNKKWRYESMEHKFNAYLKLADGNNNIALNFLDKADSSYKTEFPEFFLMEGDTAETVTEAPEAS